MTRCLIPLFLLLAAVAQAQEPLSSEMKTYLVSQDASGTETITATERATPGDVVEYRLVYKNESGQPLSGLVITGPIPANTVYLKDSAVADVEAVFTVSIDDGSSFEAEPVTRTTTGPDGQSQNIIVPPGDYTQLRWIPRDGIQPDQVQEYRYRVKVQ